MDYHKDTKVSSDVSSPTFTGKNDMIDASSYSVSDSIGEARTSNATTTTTVSQSPPRRSMDKIIGGYDPNRIPLSIFSSRPTNLEWSLASTESLFSITLGKSDESNFPYSYSSSTMYQSMEAINNNAIGTDSQNETDFRELNFNKTTTVDAFEPNMNAKTIQENVDEKIGDEDMRMNTRVINEFSILEPIREDESNEDKVSPERTKENASNEDTTSTIDRTASSIVNRGNQDLSTSNASFRSENECVIHMNNPPHTAEIKIEEEHMEPQTVDQAPISSLGGWLTCFNCCFSWKLVCC